MLKKYSFNSNNDLKNVKDLATWLYIYGNVEVCNLLDHIVFSGDYNIWRNVELTCCLKARIAREQGNLEECEQIIEKIRYIQVEKRFSLFKI